MDVSDRLLTIAAGDSPQQHSEWWNTLGPEDRDALIAMCPARIGAMNGLPAVDRDAANRMVLETEYERLTVELEQLSETETDTRQELEEKLEGMEAIQNRLDQSGDDLPQAYLLGINTEGDGQYIVANGNPDTADHSAVYIPGTTHDLGSAGDQMATMTDPWRQTEIHADGQSVSTITWLGYDAPDSSMPFSNGDSLVPEAISDRWAVDGGPDLNAFSEGLRVSHTGTEPSHTNRRTQLRQHGDRGRSFGRRPARR